VLRVTRKFLFTFLSAAFFVLLVGQLTAFPQAPAAPTPSREPRAFGSTSSHPTAAPPAATPRNITEYTLPPDLYRKARNRSRIQFASQLFGFAYGLFLLWLVLQRRWSASFRDRAERVSQRRFLQAFIFTPLLVLTIGVLTLPLDIFDEVVLKLYKISVQPWPSWIADWAKAQFLVIILGSLLAWLLYAIIRKSPCRWWLYFWFLSLPIMVFFLFISPFVIEPMFNKFEPLAAKAPQLIEPLQRVTKRAGQEVPPERMLWMKASDKTIATNAYVSGFDASKRIVIWDTTIAQETTDEVLNDFGHEMGHYVLGHIWKGFVFFAAVLFVLLFLGYLSIGWLLARSGRDGACAGLTIGLRFPRFSCSSVSSVSLPM
jgi:Zn-dependent protease with chaperone function